ncbi:MAG: hypothetical protein A4E47_01479 [Methanosaeta sp. PtaU1.Bin028]|nr:MAG: hypothetical protein A4E47_01479 [Methanosaeta sp. PtaU1.Bin028]
MGPGINKTFREKPPSIPVRRPAEVRRRGRDGVKHRLSIKGDKAQILLGHIDWRRIIAMGAAEEMIQACRYLQTCLLGGLLIATLLVPPAGCAGFPVLLPSGVPLLFANNISLLVEDVDPQAGKVWIALQGGSGTLRTAVLDVGGRFTYVGDTRIDFTVTNIYAGGQGDLVSLMILDGILVKNAPLKPMPQPLPNTSKPAPSPPPRSPGFEAAQLLAAGAFLLMWLRRPRIVS